MSEETLPKNIIGLIGAILTLVAPNPDAQKIRGEKKKLRLAKKQLRLAKKMFKEIKKEFKKDGFTFEEEQQLRKLQDRINKKRMEFI